MGIERDRQEALFANDIFYRAFADGDFDAMRDIWSTGADVFCLHPGAEIIRGGDSVIESWRQILTAPPPIDCVSPQVYVQDAIAVILCFEQVGGADGGFLAATNLFRLEQGLWRLFHHQAGPSAGPTDPKTRANLASTSKTRLN